MSKFIWAALLLAVGYALGASGVVPELRRELIGVGAESEIQNVAQRPTATRPAKSLRTAISGRRQSGSLQRECPASPTATRFARSSETATCLGMADYDAPECDRPYGRESTAELASLLAGGIVQIENRGDGGFGRMAGRVFVGETDINFEMVRRGAGWFDPTYAQDEELYIVENAARDAKVGLWALPAEKRIEPWVWRSLPKEVKAMRR